MASTTHTLDTTYVQISDGSATIQKKTKGYGAVMIFFGSAVPGDDTNSFLLDTNVASFYETSETIYARTPHDVPVEIVVGS